MNLPPQRRKYWDFRPPFLSYVSFFPIFPGNKNSLQISHGGVLGSFHIVMPQLTLCKPNRLIVNVFYKACRISRNPSCNSSTLLSVHICIHPFLDGNGRTSRLLMNYQLLKNGFLPVSVAKEDRLDYYNALDKYAAEGDLQPFMELVATLEETRLDKYLSHVPKQKMKPPVQTT